MDNKILTMETFRNSMRKFLYPVSNEMYDLFCDENQDITDEEIIEKILDDIVTENVLKYINNKMEKLPVAKLYAEDDCLTDDVIEMEENIGHNIEYIKKIIDKPMFCLGYMDISVGSGGFYLCIRSVLTFIDIDGKIHYIDEDTIQTSNLRLKMYSKSNMEYNGLDNLSDLIPEKYDGILYSFI